MTARALTIVASLVAATGCASTTAFHEVQRKNEALHVENERLRHALEAAQATGGIDALSPRRMDAFIEFRPTFCNGGMCLELTNHRPFPVGNLRIDGDPVVLRRSPRAPSADGGVYLQPGERAYVRLLLAKRYEINADVLDAVAGPNGRFFPPTGVVLEHCEIRIRVPSASHLRVGVAPAVFEDSQCSRPRSS